MFEELRELGLTENEVTIYITLLKLGTANPSLIAEKTNLSRSYIYDSLERLHDKEMVSFIQKEGKKHYQATNPERIRELLKVKTERITKIIPKLIDLTKLEKEDMKVELNKGKNVYKSLLKDMLATLEENDEVLIFGLEDDKSLEREPILLRRYFKILKQKNIIEKVIIRKGAVKLKEAKTTTYKTLPKEFIGNTSFQIYSNKVAIFLEGLPNYLILIENKTVADSYRKQFEILWERAE
jgi:sugar-specific transcriptional regulator TrmB